ncbi:unnamed protein product, partial [Prorocentrum cordatum]
LHVVHLRIQHPCWHSLVHAAHKRHGDARRPASLSSAPRAVRRVGGFVLTMWMGKFGRRTFQMWGFFGMAVCMIAVGLSYESAPMLVLVLAFGVQKIFDSGGPGATTFIIPGEIFPTSVRATCHGVSSAAGKLGAFAGMYLF